MTHTTQSQQIENFLNKNRDSRSAKSFHQQGIYPHLCGYGLWSLKRGQEYVKNVLKKNQKKKQKNHQLPLDITA